MYKGSWAAIAVPSLSHPESRSPRKSQTLLLLVAEKGMFELSSILGEIGGDLESMTFNDWRVPFVQVVMVHPFRWIAIGYGRIFVCELVFDGT